MEVLAAHQQPAADEQHLDVRGRAFPDEAHDVLVHVLGLRHALALQGALDLEDAVPDASGFLKIFPLGRRVHHRAVTFQELRVPAFEEHPRLLDDLVVLLGCLVADAGGHAALDLVFDAGPLGLAVDLDSARGQGKDLLDRAQGLPQRAGGNVGAVVERAVVLHFADDREAGKGLLDRQAQVWVVFVVS